MKKLGICVRYDCNNYGSMLQIFATQQAVARCGWEFELIRYDKKTLAFLIKNISRVFNPYFIHGKWMDIQKNKKLREYPDIFKKSQERLTAFAEFREEYIGPYSPIFRGYNNLVKGTERYDAVMVGSDQLWTPAGLKSKFYNLLFVPDVVKKISLATSFGITEVPKKQIGLTTEYLSRIEHLSVREISGADIVKRLTGRDAVVAADPTLLFTGEEWETMFPSNCTSEVPYIFAYFLGDNSKHREAVNNLAEETGLKVITCPFMDEFVEEDLTFGDEQRFQVGPAEFLDLIRGAEYICTDSFHGSVFSILNHKKFVTFSRYQDALRKSKNSRIESLFGILGLEKRHYTDVDANLKTLLEEPIDYCTVESNLKELRERSFDFLMDALSD